MTKPKHPRDPNPLAHFIAAIATGKVEDIKTEDGKTRRPWRLGAKGASREGCHGQNKLTADERSAIAKKAAKSRWNQD